MADRLTVRQRVEAIEHLGAIAESLNDAAIWLGNADAHACAELAEQAAEKLAACCWILGSAIRAREPGLLAFQTRDAAAPTVRPPAGSRIRPDIPARTGAARSSRVLAACRAAGQRAGSGLPVRWP